MGAHHARGREPLLDGGGGSNTGGRFTNILAAVLGVLAGLLFTFPFLYYPYLYSCDNGKYPEYSVAVVNFSGLDVDTGGATMDPTFHLAVRIKEPRRWSTACVKRGTTAVVSYGGARLASGPVPGFCGQNENTTEVGSVMAWGIAVPVPRFARERLADELRRGEADVDVKLMAPARYCATCDQEVIECKARLGSGEASPPCSVRFDVPTFPDGQPGGPQQARKQLRTP